MSCYNVKRILWYLMRNNTFIFVIVAAIRFPTYSPRRCDILWHWRQLETCAVSHFRLRLLWSPHLQTKSIMTAQQGSVLSEKLIIPEFRADNWLFILWSQVSHNPLCLRPLVGPGESKEAEPEMGQRWLLWWHCHTINNIKYIKIN